jgi:RNA ligase
MPNIEFECLKHDVMDFTLLQRMIDDGYVHVNKHPQAELYIYNYTAAAQYDVIWNEITLQCRGLIMDNHKRIVARPLRKFFNLEETKKVNIPNEAFEVYEKLDGSLGILYFLNGQPYIASRGSFSSEQAQKATEILHQKYISIFEQLNPEWTYIFEIIYPSNRIVVDYGDMEDLILLAILDTQTGKDIELMEIGFPLVKKYNGISDYNQLKLLEEDNREGFVIKFENGYRVKVKFEEYKRLHYILTNVSNISIWEHLKAGDTLNEILHLVPDEFYNWVRKTEANLRTQFKAIEDKCRQEFKIYPTRKETAEYFKTCTYPNILFKMMDNKDYSSTIWRMLRPEFEKPFRD